MPYIATKSAAFHGADLERRALSLFLGGRISAASDSRVAGTLEILSNVIAGHNRRGTILLNLQIAAHGIAYDPHCCGIVADLEIASYRITWTHGGCPDLERRLTVLECEVAIHTHSAQLVLDCAGREILDLEIT